MPRPYREPPPGSPISSRTRNARPRNSAPGRLEIPTLVHLSGSQANARSSSLAHEYGSRSNSGPGDSIDQDDEQSYEGGGSGAEDEEEVESKEDGDDEVGSENDGDNKDGDDDKSGGSEDETGRGWRWREYFPIAFIAILLACVAGLVSEPLAPAPPCHVLNNPNRLVPCAISIDLNRALSAIPREALPGGQDDFFALTDEESLDDYDMQVMQTFSRYVEPSYAWHDRLDLRVYRTTINFEAAEWRAQSDISNSSSSASLILRLLFGWAFPLEQHEMVVFRDAAKALFSAVYDMASPSQRSSNRQRIVDRAHLLLQHRVMQQQHLNQRVHQLSQRTGTGRTSAAEAVSELETERQYLLRLLLSEAVLTCWLEGVELIESTVHDWSQKIWKEGQIFLHRVRHAHGHYSRNRLRTMITDQGRLWSDEASTMIDDAHNSALLAEKSCAERWAQEKIGYCVAANEVAKNAYQNWTQLDPTVSGCISHPDNVLWEWHNAIPIELQNDHKSQEPFSSNSSRARFWMHRVFTHADLARITRVSTSGETIPFSSTLLLTIGPLRFWKMPAYTSQDGDVAK